MEKLYIYTRVSSDKQKDGYSLVTQREHGERIAKEYGLEPILFNESVGSSRHEDITNRPVLEELMSLVKKGKVKHVYAVKMDRFSRNNLVTEGIKVAFKKHNVIIYTKDGVFDLSDYTHELLVGIQGLFSQYDNQHRMDAFMRGVEKAVELGKWQGPTPPYGYRRKKKKKTIEIDPVEAQVVKKMYQFVLEGHGQNTIARMLNHEGIPTKRGGNYIWKGGTIYSIVTNSIYKGDRKYKGKIYKVPAIIDKKTWTEVQQQLKKNKNYSSNHTKHFYLLKGLLKCSKCNRNMAGLIKEKKGMRVYYCRSKRPDPHHRWCGLKNINIYKLNDIVWFGLLNVLTNSDNLRLYLQRKFNNAPDEVLKLTKKISKQQSKISEIETKLSRLAKGYVDGKFSDRDYNTMKLELDSELIMAQGRLDVMVSQQNQYSNGQSQYKELINYLDKMEKLRDITDEYEKKRVINIFIQEIAVDWLEDAQEHVIEIKLKVPLETEGTDVLQILGDGTDLDSGTNVIEQRSLHYYEKYRKELGTNVIVPRLNWCDAAI